MDGRAHTGSELARHIGVASSTVSEHLSKLLDADIVAVEPQGRHRYWRLANPAAAKILESLGAHATSPADRKSTLYLAHARTCYDHLAGELAVAIYGQLLDRNHLRENGGHLVIRPSGFDLLSSVGVDIDAVRAAKRPRACPCLDWTQRRFHSAGSAGKELLVAFTGNGWAKPGNRPRSIRITDLGRTSISSAFGLKIL